MDQHLNLDYLHTFVIAAKTGKLTTTSEIVYLSHSAVSTQIKNIERRLGTTLFIRNKDSLSLTKQGQLLLDYANKILNLNDIAVSKLKSNSWEGNLSIGIPTDYASLYTENFFPEVKKKLSDYSINTVCSRSRILRQRLQQGDLDFIIVAMEPQYSGDILLWQEPLQWVYNKKIDLNSNSPLPIALFSDNCIINDYSLFSLRKSKKDFNVIFKSTMMDNLVSCVKSGIAISLLPQSLIDSSFEKVPSDYLNCSFDLKIGCAWNHDKKVDPNTIIELTDIAKRNIIPDNIK